ncbi:hypothetical protein [Pseudomonas aeruginosa]|jgi:hypothetical protein|uniref:hypothetical protein n=1 Tax=Pseudomonas aeruginosa TaxID=287 RepID=UPI0025B12F56|nr:hypothetical protein [Pseudomonas aeruginosa]MDN2540108.1 hypothetical protein [Pseudomonas aeruginosa]MDN2545451.1 hypothetical protein [Pseudomonas aeruginosa]MDN2551206.1 hypothetical protein [Pseudomonas aeruginosa]
MKLDKHQARAFIRENSNHSKGDYNPSKYVLEGWVMETPEAVLRALIIKAYADKLAARKASQESHKAKTGRYLSKHDQKPGRGIDKATGVRRAYLRSPRWELEVPKLVAIGEGVFVMGNCKHNDSAVMILAAEAIRPFQARRLP